MRKVLPYLIVALIVLCGFGAYIVRAFKPPAAEEDKYATVERGDVVNEVVETGTLDAVKTVEVKSRVSGRLASLLVDAGDRVTQGQLIGVIDPLETRLLVEQNRAQVSGAQSGVQKAALEIVQRRATARAAYEQAKQRLAQLEQENRVQPTLTRSSIEQSETAYNSAVQDRDRLKNSVQPNQRVAAQSSQREALANFNQAKRELNRQQELLSKGYTAQKIAEAAEQNVEVAKARLDSANDSLARLESQQALELAKANELVHQTEAQLQTARANQIQVPNKRQEYLSAIQDVEKARAALQDVAIMEKGRDQSSATVKQLSSVLSDSERQMRETQIRAPITGIVSKKLMQEGELVASLNSFSSGSPIVQIEDRTQMRVKMDVNEIDVAKMYVGMPTKVTVDALPLLKMNGVVKKIAPSSNAAATTNTATSDAVVKYQVEVYITDAPKDLRSGMSAKCSMEVVHKDKVLRLPIEFVGKDGDQRFVELPPAEGSRNSKPERKNIVTGAETGTYVEIVSGIKEGVKVQRPEYKGPKRKGMMQMGPE